MLKYFPLEKLHTGKVQMHWSVDVHIFLYRDLQESCSIVFDWLLFCFDAQIASNPKHYWTYNVHLFPVSSVSMEFIRSKLGCLRLSRGRISGAYVLPLDISVHVSIDTLNWHCDQYSITILIDSLVNTWYTCTVSLYFAECWRSQMHRSKIGQLSTNCQPRWWWSVNWVLTECWSRVSIKNIDCHSTADAFSIHDPNFTFVYL